MTQKEALKFWLSIMDYGAACEKLVLNKVSSAEFAAAVKNMSRRFTKATGHKPKAGKSWECQTI